MERGSELHQGCPPNHERNTDAQVEGRQATSQAGHHQGIRYESHVHTFLARMRLTFYSSALQHVRKDLSWRSLTESNMTHF